MIYYPAYLEHLSVAIASTNDSLEFVPINAP